MNSYRLKVLYLFSGIPRKGSVAYWLRIFAKRRGFEVEVHCIDIRVRPHYDLTKSATPSRVSQEYHSREILCHCCVTTLLHFLSGLLGQPTGPSAGEVLYSSEGTPAPYVDGTP